MPGDRAGIERDNVYPNIVDRESATFGDVEDGLGETLEFPGRDGLNGRTERSRSPQFNLDGDQGGAVSTKNVYFAVSARDMRIHNRVPLATQPIGRRRFRETPELLSAGRHYVLTRISPQ